jgi:hypothetical protein
MNVLDAARLIWQYLRKTAGTDSPSGFPKKLVEREITEDVVETSMSLSGLWQPRHRVLVLYGGNRHGHTLHALRVNAAQPVRFGHPADG